MIYLDQAASSFPKPIEVADAMYEAVVSIGANPGRGGNQLARQASHIIQETRENIAHVFGSSNPKKCIFHVNATGALNQAIKGLGLKKGDHVVTTSHEHNSIRRPLEFLKKDKQIDITYVNGNLNDENFVMDVIKAIKSTTKLIAMTHASNVTGSILPIKTVCSQVKDYNIPILIDASQTAGHLPIHMGHDNIDMLVFPGHKGILGPQGTGVLLVEGDIELEPLVQGGTGAYSEKVEQPLEWPMRLESGTLNTPGIAGLNAAVKAIMKKKTNIVPRGTILVNKLIKGLKTLSDVEVYGPGQGEDRLPIAAFNIKNVDSQEIAMILDSHYNIAVRGGLHCNPLTHQTLGTINQGAVRVSMSEYNTEEEVNQILTAIKEIASAYSGV